MNYLVNFFFFRCEDGENSHDPLMAGLLQEPRELPDPITVPYLNPLVLRKELENVLNQEGDSCLTKQKFIQEHPIVYWNLIWYYERVNLPSHLPELWLGNCERKTDPLSTCPTVGVRTLWDNEKLHMDRIPMYLQWKNNIEDRASVAFIFIISLIFLLFSIFTHNLQKKKLFSLVSYAFKCHPELYVWIFFFFALIVYLFFH